MGTFHLISIQPFFNKNSRKHFVENREMNSDYPSLKQIHGGVEKKLRTIWGSKCKERRKNSLKKSFRKYEWERSQNPPVKHKPHIIRRPTTV